MSTATAIQSQRQRNLAVLGAISLFFTVLAVLAVVLQAQQMARKFAARPFFPTLAAEINGLSEIAITSKSASFHVKLNNGNWGIVERDNFPAAIAELRGVGIGMAELEQVEPKTARADWLPFLGLEEPAKMGDAVDVKLSDASGKVLAQLLVGKSQGAPDATGRTEVYVRKPGENQAWLARGNLAPKGNIADWLDRNVLGIAPDRIKGAMVTPPTGPAYTLSRDAKEQNDFKLLDLPAGRSLSFEGSPDGVAGAIASFTFEDVAKADQFDFTRAPQTVTNTFDGLNITVKVATKDKDHWASVSASGANPMVAAEATAINARVQGRAFKLPDDKFGQFTATRETLLKPPGGAPAAP